MELKVERERGSGAEDGQDIEQGHTLKQEH